MFKVDDQVKVICDHPIFGWGPFVKKGDVGVVSKVGDNGEMRVDFPDHPGWFGHSKEFELVAPAKKVYTLADLKVSALDAKLKASAVDARTLRKLRDRVVFNLNKGTVRKRKVDRLTNIIDAFSWRDSPEGPELWSRVYNGKPIKFEDIPAKPRVKKAKVEQAPAAPAQPRVDIPLAPPPAPVVVRDMIPEAPAPKKKVGWW